MTWYPLKERMKEQKGGREGGRKVGRKERRTEREIVKEEGGGERKEEKKGFQNADGPRDSVQRERQGASKFKDLGARDGRFT